MVAVATLVMTPEDPPRRACIHHSLRSYALLSTSILISHDLTTAIAPAMANNSLRPYFLSQRLRTRLFGPNRIVQHFLGTFLLFLFVLMSAETH